MNDMTMIHGLEKLNSIDNKSKDEIFTMTIMMVIYIYMAGIVMG